VEAEELFQATAELWLELLLEVEELTSQSAKLETLTTNTRQSVDLGLWLEEWL